MSTVQANRKRSLDQKHTHKMGKRKRSYKKNSRATQYFACGRAAPASAPAAAHPPSPHPPPVAEPPPAASDWMQGHVDRLLIS